MNAIKIYNKNYLANKFVIHYQAKILQAHFTYLTSLQR